MSLGILLQLGVRWLNFRIDQPFLLSHSLYTSMRKTKCLVDKLHWKINDPSSILTWRHKENSSLSSWNTQSKIFDNFLVDGQEHLSWIWYTSMRLVDFGLTRAGPLLGAERAGPRGCLNTPTRLTRLLGHVATCGKRHSKERQKSWRNWFSHFLGQVKGQVTRGHQRSNFAVFNIFLQSGT